MKELVLTKLPSTSKIAHFDSDISIISDAIPTNYANLNQKMVNTSTPKLRNQIQNNKDSSPQLDASRMNSDLSWTTDFLQELQSDAQTVSAGSDFQYIFDMDTQDSNDGNGRSENGRSGKHDRDEDLIHDNIKSARLGSLGRIMASTAVASSSNIFQDLEMTNNHSYMRPHSISYEDMKKQIVNGFFEAMDLGDMLRLAKIVQDCCHDSCLLVTADLPEPANGKAEIMMFFSLYSESYPDGIYRMIPPPSALSPQSHLPDSVSVLYSFTGTKVFEHSFQFLFSEVKEHWKTVQQSADIAAEGLIEKMIYCWIPEKSSNETVVIDSNNQSHSTNSSLLQFKLNQIQQQSSSSKLGGNSSTLTQSLKRSVDKIISAPIPTSSSTTVNATAQQSQSQIQSSLLSRSSTQSPLTSLSNAMVYPSSRDSQQIKVTSDGKIETIRSSQSMSVQNMNTSNSNSFSSMFSRLSSSFDKIIIQSLSSLRDKRTTKVKRKIEFFFTPQSHLSVPPQLGLNTLIPPQVLRIVISNVK